MMITCSSTPDISLHESTSMSWSSTLDECKECSPEKLNKERMKRQPQDFEAYQKETLVCR
jgi:hypothetical protein